MSLTCSSNVKARLREHIGFLNPHYHRITDSMETLDFVFMARLVQKLVLFFSGGGREKANQ